jgi:hypothetical protein
VSRKDQDRILHALHYYRESIDEEFTVTCDQIFWVAAHSFADGSDWYKGDDLQSFDSSVIPREFRKKLLMSKFDLPLRYLHYRRLIKLSRISEETMDVAVTFAGADRAMRLHTRWGRWELWYEEHKNGFVGLVTTVAVSLITALLTVYIIDRLHQPAAPPTRANYEAEPN